MDLTLNADQLDLRSGLRDYLGDVWGPDRLRAASDGSSFDLQAWKSLAELGVFGLTSSEEDGGMGLGLADAVIVFEELGRFLVPGPLTATFLAAGLIPGAADGKAVVTSVDTSDPVSVVEHPDSATHVVVVDDDGLFLLPAPALSPAAAHPLDPLTPVASVDVDLTSGERLGTAEDAARWRLTGSVLTAALQVGVAGGALDLAVRYARERVQFDRVIGSFQAVKHLLAESLVRVDLARAAVLVAALTLDDPQAGVVEEAASAAKVLADDAAAHCTRAGVQVHGGMGFTWEVLAHLYVKRAWVLETCFGSADEHALRLGEGL